VFPYVTDLAKLNETSLPSKCKFHSTLTLSDVSNEDCAHATNVWNVFGCQTLGDYSDMYLKTDVFLLADVMQNFTDISRSTITGLDPCGYDVTSPSLSYGATKKYTRVALDLMTDFEMTQFIIENVRGGLSHSATYTTQKPTTSTCPILQRRGTVIFSYGTRREQFLRRCALRTVAAIGVPVFDGRRSRLVRSAASARRRSVPIYS